MRTIHSLTAALAYLAFSIVPAKSESPIAPSKWIVTEIFGTPVLAESSVLIEFPGDGTVAGTTGVNRFGGIAEIDGQKIRFDRLRSTRRAASPELMDQESRFNRALANTEQFSIDSAGILTLLGGSPTPLLQARRNMGE